jgi:PAS domain S-box-containing protein
MAVTPAASAHEFLLRMSAEDSSAVMWSTDCELRVVSCCGRGLDRLGIGPAQRSSVSKLSELFPVRVCESPVVAAHRRALNGEYASFRGEWGGARFQGRVAPERNAEMQIVGCVGFAQQIDDGEPVQDASLAGELEFRTLVGLSPAGIYLTDAKGDCTYVNQRWCAMAGLTPGEALGDGWVRGIHPDDRQTIAQRWYAAAWSNATWAVEYRMQTPQGDSMWVFGQARALRDGEGRLTGYLGINVDITERREAEDRLRQSEQRYRQLLGGVTSYRYSVTLEKGVSVATEHTPGCLAATGYAAEEYAADPFLWINMVHPDDQDTVRQHVARVLEQEKVPPIEHRIVRKGGAVRWVRDTIISHFDDTGALVRYDGLVEDITERKRVEQRLRRVLESAPDAMVLVDGQGRILLANDQTERLFGFTRDELLQQPVEILVPERLRQKHARLRADYSAAPGNRLMDERSNLLGCRKDGSEFPAEISLSPIETEEGMLIAAAVRDITERKRAEQQLQSNLQIQSALNALLELSLEPLSLEEQLARCLDVLLSVPWIALESKGSIFLVEDDPAVLVMKAQRGLSESLLAGCARVPVGRCLCGRAAATRQIVYADCVDDRHDLRYSGMLPHGHYCVPILSDHSLLGVINLYVKEGHEKTSDEERFLTAVAHVLAGIVKRKQAEESLRGRDAQLIAAQRIQQHLLPRSAPSVPGFDVAGASFPAEFAAGDHFDYLPLSDGAWGIVVGDVSGHGFSSALLMASTSAHLRSFVEDHTDVEEILVHTNSLLCRETEEGRFVTLFFARLDPASRVLHFAGAGHPAGYVLDHSGNVKNVMKSNRVPLAILPESDFPVCGPIQLEPNDVVLLVTDGILEAASPEGVLFGTQRMLEIVRANRHRKAEEIIETLQMAVREFIQREQPSDDVTAVVIKVEPTPG